MNVLLKTARIRFPVIYTAKLFGTQEGEPKFSLTVLLDKIDDASQITALEQSILEVATQKWSGGPPRSLKKCLGDGVEKDYAGYEGSMFVNASNTTRPTLVDRNRTALTAEDAKFYDGCYCNVSINLWAQDNQFGKRINASLRGVQFVKDGEHLGGAKVMDADEFEDLPEGDITDE